MSVRYSCSNDGRKILAQRLRPARGFTLIELVIVIGLILVLVGLTMAVGLAVRAQSETRQTANVLILLDHAVKQWEIAADRQLSWGTEDLSTGVVYDINEPDLPDLQLTQLLGRISTNQSAKDILAQIDNDFLQQEDDNGDTFLKLVDPWGRQICLIHPGRVVDLINFGDDPQAADLDGTVRTNHENEFGVAVNRALLFVSAGPDGDFGDLDPDSSEFDPGPAADNVYSYKPGKPVTP